MLKVYRDSVRDAVCSFRHPGWWMVYGNCKLFLQKINFSIDALYRRARKITSIYREFINCFLKKWSLIILIKISNLCIWNQSHNTFIQSKTHRVSHQAEPIFFVITFETMRYLTEFFKRLNFLRVKWHVLITSVVHVLKFVICTLKYLNYIEHLSLFVRMQMVVIYNSHVIILPQRKSVKNIVTIFSLM